MNFQTTDGKAYMNNDSLVQQALLLCRHDKVMCVVPVIHNVLQIDSCNKRFAVRRCDVFFKSTNTV